MAIEDSASPRTDGTSGEVSGLIEDVGESIHDGELQFRVFNDPNVYQLELETIFAEAWVFVGHESEIPKPGDYARRYIGEDPFIFVRDEDGTINVLFDSCRHRGVKICRAEQGNTSHFRCPYHGWTYNNQGDLVGVPHQPEAWKQINKEEKGLHHAPHVDSYNGLVFASLSENPPSLTDYLGEMTWYLDVLTNFTKEGMEVIGEPHRYEVDNDWKSGAENFAGDDFHTGITHQSSMEVALIHDLWFEDTQADADTMSKAYTGGLTQRVHLHWEEGHEQGHSAAFGLTHPEFPAFFGYDPELKDGFNDDGMTEDQFNLAQRGAVTVGTIFPNLSWLQIALGNGDEQSGFLSFRLWNPIGAGEMEMWNWVLGPAEATEEQKETIYNVATNTFSPAGTWEQDDFAVWDGVAESASSVFAKKYNLKTDYTMGMEGMSETEILEEWPGPGVCYDSHYEEGYARQFFDRWHQFMSNGVEHDE